MIWKAIYIAGCWAMYLLDPTLQAFHVASGVTIGVIYSTMVDL